MPLAPPGSSQSPPLAGVFRHTEGGDAAARAAAIVARLSAEADYDRAFASELAAIARGPVSSSWELRRVACLALEWGRLRVDDSAGAAWGRRRGACLALECELLRIDDAADLASFLRNLRLLTRSGKRVQRRVVEEGFTTTEIAGFAAELRARVLRFEWIHAGLTRRDERAAADFLAHARHECFLTLGRYCLRPREVVREIVARVRRTRGVPYHGAVNAFSRDEMRRGLQMLPRYERAIVELLMREPAVYWVADATPSEINALIEFPLGTVAMVVKPPGSDAEIGPK